MTLAVKSTLPHGNHVVETVSTGNVPQDALAIFETLNREYAAAALTNELKLGSIPSKQVRATEVVEASQSQAITLDGIVADLEQAFITRVLKLSWYNILQNADDIPEEALTGLVDRQVAVLLTQASPAERFALLAGKTKFKVNGLSGTLARAQDFQKFMALMQAVQQNPLLFQAFVKKFSADKALRKIMNFLNINIETVEKDSEELAQAAQDMKEMGALSQQIGGGQQGGQQGGSQQGGPPGMNGHTPPGMSAPGANGVAGSPLGGGSDLAAQVNQYGNPKTGLTPNA